MGERTYLYGGGRRKHIAAVSPAPGSNHAKALCGRNYYTEDFEHRYRTNWGNALRVEGQIENLRALPVCKTCTSKAVDQ